MAQISKVWEDANEAIENFKKEFESKFGFTINIHFKVKKLNAIPNLSLQELLNEINGLLEEDYPDGKFKTSYGTVIINNGIQTKTRAYELVILRQIFCYIAHDLGYSSVTIGRFLGKDHATVLYSVKTIHNAIEIKSKHVMNKYERIISNLVVKYGDKINKEQKSNTGGSTQGNIETP